MVVTWMRKGKLEDFDVKILKLLNGDPEMTYAEMAKHLNTSAVTVYNRLKKMKNSGVFKKCLKIPPHIFNKRVSAFVLISTIPGRERDVGEQVARTSEVLMVKGITGDFDLIAEVIADDIDTLQHLVMEKIRGLNDVVRTNTVIELFTIKDEISYLPEAVEEST
ncbi:MAG: Lrp/AsnC family transcriptional regulator [Candidatus Bathyarchaeia archaeon]